MIEVLAQIIVLATFVAYVYIVCYGRKVFSRGLLMISIMLLCAAYVELDDKITDLKDQLLRDKE